MSLRRRASREGSSTVTSAGWLRRYARAVQIPRPPALGDQSVVAQLRSVLFSEAILGATSARPKGYRQVTLSWLLGWFGPLLARRATRPLPPAIVYIAVTPVDIRLFSKPKLSNLFEIGRWKKGSYRASAKGKSLSLELEGLGAVELICARDARPVVALVLEGSVS